jgi:hypothetical protein
VPDGFALVSFDWPSGNGFHDGKGPYANDQENAAKSARMLIKSCLAPLVEKFTSKNVHLFAHSMGALVTETAFTPINNPGSYWKINHVLLAAGDVDASNYKAGSETLGNFLDCCSSLSVYSSKDDSAMEASWIVNRNRRLGQIGFSDGLDDPQIVPSHCTSILCTNYWDTYLSDTEKDNLPTGVSTLKEFSHVWYIMFNPPQTEPGNAFYGDMVSVLTDTASKNRRAIGEAFDLVSYLLVQQ